MLKVGSSEGGARAAGAHTGALAGDQRVFAALLEEAGAAQASEPGELLELARALATPRRDRAAAAPPTGGIAGGGLAILTCSGGDSGVAADLAAARGLELPELSPPTRERLAAMLPSAATVANPLDYTSMLWDDHGGARGGRRGGLLGPGDRPAAAALRPAARPRPRGRRGLGSGARGRCWPAPRAATRRRSSARPCPSCSTRTARRSSPRRGRVATAAGLGAAIACAAALRTPLADPERLREIAAAAERRRTGRVRPARGAAR